MNYDTLHQNFILLAPATLNQYLADGAFWQTFTDCLSPLVSPIKGVPHVKAAQYDGHKAVKLGRLSWRVDVLQKLTDNYRQSSHPDTFFFEFLSAYFPNLSACVKQNETPKLTLALEQPYNQSYSSLLLSLRQDYFDDLGAAFVFGYREPAVAAYRRDFAPAQTAAVCLSCRFVVPWRMDGQHPRPERAYGGRMGRWEMAYCGSIRGLGGILTFRQPAP